jgi:putative transposase
MEEKGRSLDNTPIERFWRTLKHEEIHLKTYDPVLDAKEALSEYIHGYNHGRRHSGINHHKPFEVMTGLKEALM